MLIIFLFLQKLSPQQIDEQLLKMLSRFAVKRCYYFIPCPYFLMYRNISCCRNEAIRYFSLVNYHTQFICMKCACVILAARLLHRRSFCITALNSTTIARGNASQTWKGEIKQEITRAEISSATIDFDGNMKDKNKGNQ